MQYNISCLCHGKDIISEKKTVASDDIRDAMEVISDPWAKSFEVGDVGQKLFLNIYGGTRNYNLIT